MENMGKMSQGLSETHGRVIRSALIHLDQILSRFEQLAEGFEIRSELYELRNTLTLAMGKKLAGEISELRRMLAELRNRFGFEKRIDDAAHVIQTHCSFLWENLCELKSEHLRHYGALPPGFGAGFDRSVGALIERIEHISELMGHTDVHGG